MTAIGAPRARNDPRRYDDLVGEWWRPGGAFAALHWLAAARAAVIPPADRPGALLVDIGCGGGLLAPGLAGRGYRHVGLDLMVSAAQVAAAHGVAALVADATAVALRNGSADVVVAGEILEHVTNPEAVVAEAARLLRPGGLFVCDTLAATRTCRVLAVSVAERLPGVPRDLHDPALFVAPRRLVASCADHGIDLTVWGLRPRLPDAVAWALRRREDVGLCRTRYTGVVYQGVGVKTSALTEPAA